jgi:hypothetical protein
MGDEHELWDPFGGPPLRVTRNQLPSVFTRDLRQRWLRVVAGIWFVFGLIVQLFHDGIVCPSGLQCFDDYTLTDRMKFAFTLVWLLSVTGLLLARPLFAWASVGLAGLGIAIAAWHMPVAWWAALEIAGFSLLGVAGTLLGRSVVRRRARERELITAPSRVRARRLRPYRRFWLRRILIASVCLVTAVAITAFSIPRARRASAFEAIAPRTDGTVLRVLDEGFRVVVVYTHPTAGRQEVSVGVINYNYERGELVEVLYDPQNARHVELDGENYDGLSVAFAPLMLGAIGILVIGGAFSWMRRLERVARNRETILMRYRRWTKPGYRAGPWITLFSWVGTDIEPIASYRLAESSSLDPWHGTEVLVRCEAHSGGLVIARDSATIFWPRSRVRVGDRFHDRHWHRIVEAPLAPPPVPGPPPPPLSEGTLL